MNIENNSIHLGDCLGIMPSIPDASIDAIITDPPYEYGFMNRGWDKTGIAFNIQVWAECLRVLKPGGYLIAFGGTRTYHRLACAIEDAGFEIRDMMEWVYRSGLTKSMSIDKAIDAAAGVEREIAGYTKNARPNRVGKETKLSGLQTIGGEITAPATEAAKQWEGWGTGLKPAHEPMVLAMKPLSEKTFVENVLKHGTGALNIDKCRIPTDEEMSYSTTPPIGSVYGKRPWMYDEEKRKKVMERKEVSNEKTRRLCRLPANVAVTDDALNTGKKTRSSGKHIRKGGISNGIYGKYLPCDTYGYMDNGSPSRYFDIDRWAETNGILQFNKPPQSERHEGCEDLEKSGIDSVWEEGLPNQRNRKNNKNAGNFHPTVKPISLLAWLVTLITKSGDLVLDPFAGSGSTARACIRRQRKYILIEKEAEYVEIARRRIKVELEQPWLFEFEN